MNATFSGKRITIIGMAREGTALARFFARAGARVTVSDMRGIADLAAEIGQLAGLPIQAVLRGHPEDILETDVVYVSPGVPREIPILRQAAQRGLTLSSETELLFEMCPAPILGVTGSSGKTTTTTLIGEMLGASQRKVWVGGNIGKPLIEHVHEIGADDWVVLELSSFQLEHLRRSPHIAVFTNLRPNHLDRHPSYEAYREAKVNILRHQSADSFVVLNADDPEVRALAGETPAQVHWFSRGDRVEKGACVEDDWVVTRAGGTSTRVLPVADIALPGVHNLANVLAATAAVTAVGVSAASSAKVAARFAGVPHRLELVRERDGVRWVNDSIATSPDRTVAALHAYPEGAALVLLAGGRDKHLPMEAMAREIVGRVRHLVTFGEAGPLVERAVREARESLNGSGRDVPITACATLDDAVAAAARVAAPGDVVLLSPSGTSFDAFKDFEARGQRFRELVKGL